MVQRFMDGPEFSVDLLCDRDGVCLNAIPRTMLESRGGESIKGQAIADPELIDLGRAVAEALPLRGPGDRADVPRLASSACASPTSTPASAARSPARCTPRMPGRSYPELIVRMAQGETIEPHVGEFLAGRTFTRYFWQLELDEQLQPTGTRHRPGRPAPATLRDLHAGAATLAAVLRPMLAGMLSVLLVAGVIGLGVFLATDEPRGAGRRRHDRARRPPARPRPPRRRRPASTDLPPVKTQDPGRRRQGRRVHAREPARSGRRARAARVHRGRLQLQPADVRDPLPDLVRGRDLRAGHHAGARPARPRARARADRDPVQARARPRRPSAGSRSSSTSSTAATTSCCSRTRPRCRTRSRRRRGGTCSAARR